MKPKIFIDGESGSTGQTLRDRLKSRKDIELVKIDPERRRDTSWRSDRLNAADVAILCLPDDAAREAVALVENPQTRIIDASTAHRIAEDWVYGFAEMDRDHAQRIAEAGRVSNPGCYATGAIAILRPLRRRGLLDAADSVTLYAISGYSGGGAAMIATYEGGSDAPPWRLYGLSLRHKHLPEIRRHAMLRRAPIFLPCVGAFRCGMAVIAPLAPAVLRKQPQAEAIEDALLTHYRDAAKIRVYSINQSRNFQDLTAEDLNGTDEMEIMIVYNRDQNQIVLIARLDNLGKGSAGAAVANLDLMLYGKALD